MIGDDEAWLQYRDHFSSLLDEANYSASLQSFVMRASHKLIERPYTNNVYFGRVIEVGVGTGEHFSFVRHAFDDYLMTDHDPQVLSVAEAKNAGKDARKVKYEVQLADSLGYSDNTFDRLIAAHVLEHIHQPHRVLQEWCRVVKEGGVLSILLPTDPGLAWRLGRHFGPRRKALAQGIPYDYVMAREHVNSCHNLVAILRHYFPGATEAWWPLPFGSIDLNLFFAFQATVIKSRR